MRGFAVVDTETTGILPGFRHRIAEIAVVHVDLDGTITDTWCTLVNPERDLGPQAIHGIRAADVCRAPRFEQIAGDIVARLTGRIAVAHNWPFDAMHLRAEFDRLGVGTPFQPHAGVCTMQAAGELFPTAGRSLIECCAAAGLGDREWHTATADAEATAGLLSLVVREAPELLCLGDAHADAAAWSWPPLARSGLPTIHRRPAGHVAPHFLARLVERIPRSGEPVVDAYLAMLDRALLDRDICDTEADGLLRLAYELGLHRADVLTAHRDYLRGLVRAAWDDGVLSEDERRDVESVAVLLGFDKAVAAELLGSADRLDRAAVPYVSVGGLRLEIGDTVVLTGEMDCDRDEITAEAKQAGLRVTTGVSGRTTVLVAADPNSMSGKARKARELGVPVVDEFTFLRVLNDLAHA